MCIRDSPWGHTPSAIEHTSSSPCSETHQCGFSRLLPERNVIARRDCSRTSRMHETGICYLPERTRTDGRAGSLFGEYGTGILYRSRTMCTQQHSKENKEMNNQKIRMYNPGKIVNGEYVFEWSGTVGRNQHSCEEISDYIITNPLRWEKDLLFIEQ